VHFIRDFVHRFPKSILIATLLITGFLGYHAFDITINTDLRHMFPDDDPAVQTFDRISEKYGGAEFMVLVLGTPDGLTVSALHTIDSLTTRLGEITGVSKVRSITNIEEIHGEDLTVEVGPLVPDLPETAEQAADIRQKISHKPRYLGTMVSNDFRYANILIQMKPEADQKQVYQAVENIRSRVEANGEETYFTGSPVLTEEIAARMKGDIIRLLPFVSLVVMLILFWAFRSVRGVLLPLIIVFISLIGTIGFSGWIGQSLSIISTGLPILLVSVGSAYAIHLLARFYEDQLHGIGREEAVSESILNVGIAIVIAGITTVAGFSSLGLSSLSIIKDFGLLTAFGILVALLVSITFLPASLLTLRPPKRFVSAERRRGLDWVFDRISTIVHRYPWYVVGTVLLCIALSLWVIPKIQPETNYITFFPRESNVRRAHDLVNAEFGGASSLEIIIDTGEENGIEDPAFLQKVDSLQQAVAGIPMLSHPMSVVDLLEEENRALHGDDSAFDRLPDAGIAQYLLLLESGSENILSDFVDFDHRELRIRVMNGSTKSRDTKGILDRVHQLVNASFGSSGEQVTVTGVPVLGEKLMDLILTSQIRSLISAVVFAFLITSVLLKSIRRGAFCSIPIAVTVLLNFGIMGWSAIPLDVATSMIASIAVGIGIDYSIHFYTRYREELRNHSDIEQALNRAIHTVGRANSFNAIAVTAGFLVLLFSTFPPLRMFGLLSSVTMLLSFLGAMILLPSLIVVFNRIRSTHVDTNLSS